MLRFGTWALILGMLGSAGGAGRMARGQVSLSIAKDKPARVVTGLPFSAEQSVSTVQEMNGMRMTHASKGRLYRSDTGQERVEMTPVVSDPTAATPGTLVYLLDPVEHTVTFWSTKTKIAIRQRLPVDGAVTLRALPTEQPHGAAARQAAELEDVTTTDLGKETREKLRLVGKRVTGTIPAGKIGNETAIVVTHDLWLSPELKLEVREVDEDPRSGSRVMELTHIVREEPDAALFQVPAGYSVTERNVTGQAVASGKATQVVPPEWVEKIAEARKGTDPEAKVDLAYNMAVEKIALPEARSLAEEAVRLEEERTSGLAGKEGDAESFLQMEHLSRSWSTLGLVYFREGDLEKGEAYARAGWELDPRGHMGAHLGRIYEAEHKPEAAIAVYRSALSARGSGEMQQGIRDRLLSLGVSAPEPLPSEVTVAVPGWSSPAPGEAVFDIVQTHEGAAAVLLVQGDAGYEGAAAAIRAALPMPLPDRGPEKVLRRGRLTCAEACRLEFLTPQEARALGAAAGGE